MQAEQSPGFSGLPVALAMDLGGHWIRMALITKGGDVVWRERALTKGQEPGEAIIARVEAVLNRAISAVGDRNVVGIGMAVASPVDPETGIIYSPPNIPGLDGVSLKSLWEKKLGWPILTGNDATLAALGEYRYGGGENARTLVYITISTGIGGGMVFDGRPVAGAYGMAGELGHMCIDRRGPRCKCGNVGCLEAFASGTAIADSARKRIEEGASSTLADMVSGDLSRISAEAVFEAAARGDTTAREVLDDAGQALGAGMVNILHLLNPDLIVVGGGVSQNWDYLQPMVESYIQAHAMKHVLDRGFKLRVSSLGDDNGLLGAAALVWQSVSLAPPHP